MMKSRTDIEKKKAAGVSQPFDALQETSSSICGFMSLVDVGDVVRFVALERIYSLHLWYLLICNLFDRRKHCVGEIRCVDCIAFAGCSTMQVISLGRQRSRFRNAGTKQFIRRDGLKQVDSFFRSSFW